MCDVDIYEKIARQFDDMSKTQKKIADYILNNQMSASFFNVNKLATAAGVSEASIVRFANRLGLKGYSQLQSLMQQYAQNQLGAKERLTLSYDAYGNREQGVIQVINEDISHIKGTLEELDMDMFFHIAGSIIDAHRVFIICGRSAASLGLFLDYYLKLIRENVYLIDNTNYNEGLIDSIGEGDLALALSFRRYTKQTVQILDHIAGSGCRIASITDLLTSPLIKYSDYYLLAQTHMSTYLDSFVAPQTIINALLTYVGKIRDTILEQRFSRLEKVWEEFDIFMK